jgi:hypothetical protein
LFPLPAVQTYAIDLPPLLLQISILVERHQLIVNHVRRSHGCMSRSASALRHGDMQNGDAGDAVGRSLEGPGQLAHSDTNPTATG